jgi:hypothetical protein
MVPLELGQVMAGCVFTGADEVSIVGGAIGLLLGNVEAEKLDAEDADTDENVREVVEDIELAVDIDRITGEDEDAITPLLDKEESTEVFWELIELIRLIVNVDDRVADMFFSTMSEDVLLDINVIIGVDVVLMYIFDWVTREDIEGDALMLRDWLGLETELITLPYVELNTIIEALSTVVVSAIVPLGELQIYVQQTGSS